ncbi:unnamed protein product, partial [Symbiodinium necroappetens]
MDPSEGSVRVLVDNNAFTVEQFTFQHAYPRVTDCAVLGYHCQDVIAVIPHEAWPDGARPTAVLLDCRPIQQGWALFLAADCLVSHSSLIYELDTFVPMGWQVQIDPIDIEDGNFTVAPGTVLVVSYVPQTTDEESSPARPWQGFHSDDVVDDSSNEDSEDSDGSDGLPPPPGGATCSAARSRSRSPQTRAHDSNALRLGCLWGTVPRTPWCFSFAASCACARLTMWVFLLYLAGLVLGPFWWSQHGPWYLLFRLLCVIGCLSKGPFRLPRWLTMAFLLGCGATPAAIDAMPTYLYPLPFTCEGLLSGFDTGGGSDGAFWVRAAFLTLPTNKGQSSANLPARYAPCPFGTDDATHKLFERVPFSALPPAPSGLDRPWRFFDWITCGNIGRSPGPGEALVITSDGSYRACDQAAGWGLSFSIASLDWQDVPGQFVGCLCGPMQPFLAYLGESGAPDAYAAEVAGLLWGAIVTLQLPIACPVLFRADNVSALQGVQGTCGMRSSPLCLAARSLHAAVSICLPATTGYEHVTGHSGDVANELSDALAALGANGAVRTSPFAFDIDHFLRDGAAASLWLPHICQTRRHPRELPMLRGQVMSWPMVEGVCRFEPEYSMQPFLRAFPPDGDLQPPQKTRRNTLSVCLVSYNALSLSDGAGEAQQGLHGAIGRPTLLQQSLIAHDVHLAGLQECRTPQGPCAASSVVVFHTSPTVLIAGATLGLVDFCPWLVPLLFSHGCSLLQKRNGALDRIEPGITSGHACVDHFAAFLEAHLTLQQPFSKQGRAARIDARAVADPQNAGAVSAVITSAPRPEWDIDASEHAAILVDHIYRGLVAHFPLRPKPMRAHFFSDTTVALHRAVAALRHAVRTRSATLRLTFLRCAWQAWRQSTMSFMGLFSGRWLWQLRMRLGSNCMLLRRFGLQLKRACRADKAAHLTRLSSEIADAPTREVHQAIQRVLRPRKFRKTTAAPLPRLDKPDGTIFRDSAEVMDTWREHFRVLEGGIQSSAEDLVLQCRGVACDIDDQTNWDAAHLPSWLALEAALRHSAPRKAVGPDLLPPAICRFFSPQLTEVFWPLLLKTVCRIREPAGLKGGVLFHIDKGKQGARATCDAHRGILAQSCLSKAFHRSLRGLIMNHWSAHALPLQLGGRPGLSSTYGHLASRSILSFARRNQLSAGLIFVDLASAYYAVIRETILGKDLANRPLQEIASALGLDDADLQRLRHLVEQEPIMHQQGASQFLMALTREMHRHTWFILSDDSKLIATQRGTRPGGTLADVLFNILFGRVLLRRQSSSLASAFPRVPWDGVRTPFPVDLSRAPATLISDIVYADDLCTPIVCEAASQLRGTVSAVTADTFDVLTPHALRPNLGPTKTSALVSPVGTGSRKVRHDLFVGLRGKVPLWPDSKGLLWMDLVSRYRHLGSIVCHDGNMCPEVKLRLALAGAAFREGRRKLYACKLIPLERRATLLRSHVLSILLAGAGTWPFLNSKAWHAFQGGVIGLYRQLLGLRATGNWHWTRSQLLSRVGLPSPEALLHTARLRLLSQLVNTAPDQIWALIAWNQEFQQGLRSSGNWFFDAMHTTCKLGRIDQDWFSWSTLIKAHPGHWKGLLKRAEAWDVETHRLQGIFDSAVRSIWSPLVPTSRLPVEGLHHACLVCGLAFASRQQWGAHAQRVHGYRNAATRLAAGRQCQACGTVYASGSRLKSHLLASARCRSFLELSDPAVLPPPLPEIKDPHLQAPSVRATQCPMLPPASEERCLALAAELSRLRCATDQEVYDTVAAHVAPLPVLRRTLEVWASDLPAGPLADSASDVLLVLTPELLCSEVCGKLDGNVPAPPFMPRLQAMGFCPRKFPREVLWHGHLDLAWIDRWPLVLDFVWLCGGPLAILCTSSLQDPCLFEVGIPVLFRVEASAEQLAPLSSWLLELADL